MKSYQILSVIGGVLGMIIVLMVYAVFSVASIMSSSFGGSGSQSTGLVSSLVGVSVVLYIIAIVIPFTLKKPKTIGIILLVLAFATLISASYFGIIGMALLIAGGISAVRYKESDTSTKLQVDDSSNNTTDILMQRYARGEITKEEFDKMKGDLDE